MEIKSIQNKLIGKNIEIFVKKYDWNSVGQLQYEDDYGIQWFSDDNIDLLETVWCHIDSLECNKYNTLWFELENNIVIDFNITSTFSPNMGKPSEVNLTNEDLNIIIQFIDEWLNNSK